MRYAFRLLVKNRSFTAVAVVSLALGIGANTLMFSIVHAVLIRPLPYPDSARLVFIWFIPPGHPDQKRPATIDSFLALRKQTQVLEHVGTVGGVEDTANLTIDSGNIPEQVESQRFSAAVPQALEAKPLMGRWFTEAETEANARAVIVISYRLWQRRFGGAADVLGKTVHVDREAATIIGVMPDGWMFFNYPAQLWQPYRLRSAEAGGRDRVLPLARIKTGVIAQQAQEAMNHFAAGLAQAFPSTSKGWGIRLEPALDVYVGWIRRPLLLVQGVVGLILLIAGANVAGLLLAQAAERRKEMALRTALGAKRWQIARHVLTESVLLALLGGVAGITLAYAGIRIFIAISPVWFPRVREIGVDSKVLGFTCLISLAIAVVFGLIPAVQSSRPNLMEALKESARGATGGMRRQQLRSALVALEMSLATVVSIGAGLMLNTFVRLYSAPTGCDTRNVVTFQVNLPSSQFVKTATGTTDQSVVEISSRAPATFEQIRERVASIPGVESAGAGVRPPLSESALGGLRVNLTIGGREKQSGSAAWFPVSAGYFHTLGVPIVRGREFGIRDTAAGPPIVLINEAMARRFWPAEDPIGKRVRIDLPDEPNREIVGVVGNIRHNRRDHESVPQMYVPYLQNPSISQRRWLESRLTMTFVIRYKGDTMRLAPVVSAAVAEVDPNLPIFNLRNIDEYVAEQLWQPRQTMTLLLIFGAIALALAVTGAYGIMAYAVQHRTQEIGIRMALGASRVEILWLVFARGLLLTAIGVAVGVAGALAASRVLESFLWGVTPADPLTYFVAILVLSMVAILACYLPARRALDVDVTMALRYE